MFKARRPPVYSEGRIFEFVPDSPVAWTLERDGNVMAELQPTEGGYLAMAHGEEVGGPFVTIEAAVAAVPALRTLDTPGAWRLTTSLTGAVAAFMLDEPAEGVEEVEVERSRAEPRDDEVAQRDVRLARFVLLVVAVEAGPADAGDVAGMAGLEALKLHHASDLSVDAVAPEAVLFRRDSFTRLKALRKKSRSSDCCPILRSNSATRRAAASSGLATGRGRLGTPGGRPTGRCKPAAPSLR